MSTHLKVANALTREGQVDASGEGKIQDGRLSKITQFLNHSAARSPFALSATARGSRTGRGCSVYLFPFFSHPRSGKPREKSRRCSSLARSVFSKTVESEAETEDHDRQHSFLFSACHLLGLLYLVVCVDSRAGVCFPVCCSSDEARTAPCLCSRSFSANRSLLHTPIGSRIVPEQRRGSALSAVFVGRE